MHVTNSSTTTIDLMLSTSLELIKSCETILPIGNLDHNGILSAISLCTHPAALQVPRKIWRYNFVDFECANEIISQVDASSVIVDGDVGASNWETLLLETMEKCIPTSTGTLPKRSMVVQIYHSTYSKKDMHFRMSRTSNISLLPVEIQMRPQQSDITPPNL